MSPLKIRPYKLFVCLWLSIFFSAATTGADAFFETPRKLHHSFDSSSWGGGLSFINDVMGPAHTDEWDDGRTAGFEGLFLSPYHIYMETAYSAFTFRSDPSAPEEVSRVDSLHFLAGGHWEGSLLGGYGHAMAGMGGIFFGNYRGLEGQVRLHKSLAQERPVPYQYDPSSAAALFSTDLGLKNPLGIPLYLGTTLSASSNRFLEGNISGGFILEGPFSMARLGINCRIAQRGDMPDSVSHYITNSSGLWLEYGFQVHALYLKYSINTLSDMPQGSAGFLFSTGNRGNPQSRWSGGSTMDFAFSLANQGYVNRIALTPESWFLEKTELALVLDIHSGDLGDSNPFTRYQKTLLGMEWSLPLDFGSTFRFSIEPYASLEAGYHLQRKFTPLDTVHLAEVENLSWKGLGRLTAGFRFLPIKIPKGDRILEYGIVTGGSVDLSIASESFSTVSFHVGLSVSDRPARSFR